MQSIQEITFLSGEMTISMPQRQWWRLNVFIVTVIRRWPIQQHEFASAFNELDFAVLKILVITLVLPHQILVELSGPNFRGSYYVPVKQSAVG